MAPLAQALVSPTEFELRAAFNNKVRRGIFAPVARHLPSEIAEERLQDAVAQTYEMYRRYGLEKNIVVPDAVLVHFCRLRATDANRYFVPSAGYCRRKCALDWRNFRDGRVEILHLDGALDADEGSAEGDRELLGLAQAECGASTRKIHSAIDLLDWLDGLVESDQQMLAGRMAGFTLQEVAGDIGVSLATVFARTKKLGKELAVRAGVELGGRDRSKRRRGGPADDVQLQAAG